MMHGRERADRLPVGRRRPSPTRAPTSSVSPGTGLPLRIGNTTFSRSVQRCSCDGGEMEDRPVGMARSTAEVPVMRAESATPLSQRPYSDLPDSLRRVLHETYLRKPDFYRQRYPEHQVWHELRDRQSTLTRIYERMTSVGLWDHVHHITSVKCELGDGIHLFTGDRRALLDALHRGRRFCRDPRIGALLHPGQTSYRELVSGSGLHLSIGGSSTFDVHLDSVAPVALGPRMLCSYDLNASLAHWGRDVIGNETGIEFLPDQRSLVKHPDPGQSERDPEAEFARITLAEW